MVKCLPVEVKIKQFGSGMRWHLPTVLRVIRVGSLQINFSPNGQILASGSDNSSIRLWSVAHHPQNVMSGHTRWVWAFGGRSNLASGSDDETRFDYGTDRHLPQNTAKGILVGSPHSSFSPNGSEPLPVVVRRLSKVVGVRTEHAFQTVCKSYSSCVWSRFSPIVQILAKPCSEDASFRL